MARALIIEDDHPTQMLLTAVLSREAIECDHAGDGKSGVLKIAEREYGAILLDLLLPVMDGFEVLRHLRKDKCDLLPRVIVVTAAAESTWRGCGEIRLVRCLLRKPLDILELAGHVRACIAEPARNRQG